MAANKYLASITGRIKEVLGLVVSTGAPDANKIVALDAAGKLDISLMPTGVGAEVTVAASFENLTAGDFVNLFLSAGVIKVQKADATNNAKPAHGFVLANVTAPADATVYRLSNLNTAVAGLTIGSDYFLATTPGSLTATPPSAAGNIVQPLGRAALATSIVLANEQFWVEIA
jgi:hypothetical protein